MASMVMKLQSNQFSRYLVYLSLTSLKGRGALHKNLITVTTSLFKKHVGSSKYVDI